MSVKYSRQERIAKFWSRVNIPSLLDCWLWKGYRVPFGYGSVQGFDGRSVLTHRFAWQITYGVIDEGLCVLHKCDVPSCCNPNHLYVGTQKDNIRDAIERGRFTYPVAPRGTKVWSNKLTEAQVLEIRELAEKGELKQRVIAKRYGISASTVNYIKQRRCWAHIP